LRNSACNPLAVSFNLLEEGGLLPEWKKSPILEVTREKIMAHTKECRLVSEREKQIAREYYLRLCTIGEGLGLKKETLLKYKDNDFLLEGVVIVGIQQLQDRLKRCNRAYKRLQRENEFLKQVDIYDLLKASRGETE